MHDVDSDLRETLVHLFSDIHTPFAAAHVDIFSKSHGNNQDSRKSDSTSSQTTESHSSHALDHSTQSNIDNSHHRSASRLTIPRPASPRTPRMAASPNGILPAVQNKTPVMPTKSWNPFDGRVSAKRPCSTEQHPVKAARRTPSIGDIKTDIITSIERLRDQIFEATEEKSTCLSKRLDLAAEQTEAKISTAQRAISSAVRQADVKLESLIAMVAEVQDLGQETDVRVKSLMDSSEARHQQTHTPLKSLMDAIQASNTKQRRMEERIKSISEAVEVLKQPKQTTPLPRAGRLPSYQLSSTTGLGSEGV